MSENDKTEHIEETVTVTNEETVWVVSYDHKHGLDISIHKTQEGAERWAIGLVERYREDFSGPESEFTRMTNEQLLTYWTEYTGENEFIFVEKYLLNE